MGYLFLFLLCIALIAYFIYDYYQHYDYFNFLLKINKIGQFLKKHEFVYFMLCFFSTTMTAIGAIYFFMKFIIDIYLYIN